MMENSENTGLVMSNGGLHKGEMKHRMSKERIQSGFEKLPMRHLSEEPSSNGDESGSDVVHIKRRLGMLSGSALIVGTMIGSGIFISPKGVIEGTGSVALSLIVWVLCGILALFGALVYAELGTIINKSGAEYVYLLEAGKALPTTLAPIPAFLFAWISVIILKPCLFAVLALSFGTYVVQPFYPDCESPTSVVKLCSILCLCLVAAINCYSLNLATKVQNFFTVAKLLALAVIIVGGFVLIFRGSTEFINEGFEDTSMNPSAIALAFYDGLWAYDGWNNLNYATEELKNPYVNLPRAIMIGIPLVTLCYLFTNLAYLAVMSKETLLASNAVAATWGEQVLGKFSIVIPIFVALSCFGAANGSCFSGARLVYAAAREGHLPEVFSYIHVNKATPTPSLLLSTFIAIMLMIPGDIYGLVDIFSFAAWLFYGATISSVLVLRRTKPNIHRPYKVPLAVPVIAVIVSIYLVIAPILQDPKIEFFYATLFIFSGLLFYIPFVAYQFKLPFRDAMTRFVQLSLQVAPSKYAPPE